MMARIGVWWDTTASTESYSEYLDRKQREREQAIDEAVRRVWQRKPDNTVRLPDIYPLSRHLWSHNRADDIRAEFRRIISEQRLKRSLPDGTQR